MIHVKLFFPWQVIDIGLQIGFLYSLHFFFKKAAVQGLLENSCFLKKWKLCFPDFHEDLVWKEREEDVEKHLLINAGMQIEWR